MMLPQILLLILASASALSVRYVRPEVSSLKSCPGEPCFTLDQYIDASVSYFTSGSEFVFLAGNHSLDYGVGLMNVSNITFRGEASSIGVNFICRDGVIILFVNVTNLYITRMRFLINSSYMASIVVFRNSVEVLIKGTTFEDLRKRSRAIHSVNSTIRLINSLFTGCSNEALLSYNSNISIYQSRFERNKGNRGGAIYALDSILQLSDNTFISNRASLRGGAIMAVRSIVYLTNSSFVNNQARVSGGAIAALQSVTSFTYSLFLRNTVEERGGAISMTASNVTVTVCAFYNNSASKRGGAINMASSTASITNNSFDKNFALKQGGAIFANESIVHLLGNFFTKNDVRISGSALFVSNSMLYQNETYKNVFEHNHGGQGDQGPITCNSCGITMIGKNGRSKAHLTEFPAVHEVLPAPSVMAIYSNSNSPGNAFVGIIALPREITIILTDNSTHDGDRYMQYSTMNPKALSPQSFFRRQITTMRGISDFLSFGKGMKSDFSFYTGLAAAINDACAHCSLELVGIAYFLKGNPMPVYIHRD